MFGWVLELFKEKEKKEPPVEVVPLWPLSISIIKEGAKIGRICFHENGMIECTDDDLKQLMEKVPTSEFLLMILGLVRTHKILEKRLDELTGKTDG